MTDLYVVRHAIAENRLEWAENNVADGERPLTEKGIKRFVRGARGLLMFTGHTFEIYTSPLVRADQTAAIIQKTCPRRVTKKQLSALGAAFDSQVVLAQLSKSTASSILIVGHEPDLTTLIQFLLKDPDQVVWKQLKKGSAVKIMFPDKIAAATGTLSWYLEPRALRDLGDSLESYQSVAGL